MVMTQLERSKPVVVGIDGSQAAIDAATWAVDEAVSRGVPLRLVHVSAAKQARRPPAEDRPCDVERAESALHRAEMTVHDMVRPVQVETAIVRGRADCVLIDESRRAAMVCVGSEGKGPCADAARFDRGGLGPACALPGSDRPVRRRAPDRQRLDRCCAKR